MIERFTLFGDGIENTSPSEQTILGRCCVS